MTTIDKNGYFLMQPMPAFADRQEEQVLAAILKAIRHFKSDASTEMGLPAPLMVLFNLLQFGSVGEEEQTIAEMVQGMYYEGYDALHFAAMAVPVAVLEVIVRVLYGVKRLREGHSVRSAVAVGGTRSTNPKLGTMLFTAHTITAGVNAGKVTVKHAAGQGNPFLAINYPQWLAFTKSAIGQLGWVVINKPQKRHKHVMNQIDEDMSLLFDDIDRLWEQHS